jgi:hypothetical protein
MTRSYSDRSTFAAKAIVFTFATTLIIAGNGTAEARVPDTLWTVSLGPAEQASLDGKVWEIELFDAVACKKLTKLTLAKGMTGKLTILARDGGGDASKGQLGGHFRWQAKGIGPGHKAMFFWGDPKVFRNNAEARLVLANNGSETSHNITSPCEKQH